MRPEIHIIANAEAYNKSSESNFCHKGTPKGMRTIITMGEVSGIMEHQKASGPSGLFIPNIPAYRAKAIITTVGTINCPVSSLELTAEPTPAKNEA